MRDHPVLALIPARSGSKSVPDKNIRDFAGKPLLAHAIEQARAARTVDRVIVSTDSQRYADIARSWGAETPFLRPAELATDDASDLVVFLHALHWLRRQENWQPEIVVHLRPTYPNRNPVDIDRAVDILRGDPSLDSVRSVAPAPAAPYKMWTRGEDALLTPVADLGTEAYNQPRQQLPRAYLQNACVDAVRSRVLLTQSSMTGRRIHGYVMTGDHDIDTLLDMERARAAAGDRAGRTFCVDLDTVLARRHTAADDRRHGIDHGQDLQPRLDTIAAVNRLYDSGCHITVLAGPRDAPPREEAVRVLLEGWGVRHNDIAVGRPAADYLVDGRALGIDGLLAIADVLAPE